MKKLIVLLVFLQPLWVMSQNLDVTKWTLSRSKEEVKVNETVDLVFTAKIDEGWKLYGLGENPPQALVTFDGKGFKTVGKMKEGPGIHKEYDQVLEMDVSYFEGKAEFKQTIRITDKNPEISIEFEGQACPKGPGQCIRVNKSFTINDLKVVSASILPTDNKTNVNTSDPITKNDTAASKESAMKSDSDTARITSVMSPKPNPVGNEMMQNIEQKINEEDTSLIGFMLLAFGAGLLSLLTPCVFPMIPLTVTFFTSSSESRKHAVRKAVFYGFSIILIFTLLGTFAGPFLANDLSTHWIPNLIFFIIFIVFGLSFLGLFEITLPSSFINKVDAQSEKGGFYGVFFMAFTLVLVSFSCTVPIVGLVLVQAQGGIALKPVLGMLAFSFAFAIPFTLFALFPQWLQKLPKSGGWMNVIKVVLGFLEFALAFKFLSMIDQVYHLHILDREVYLAIWIVLFSMMGFYLLGKLKLPHDAEVKHISVPRLMLAVIPFVFVVYLIPGMFGAPLKMLSGYLPPLSTHDFDIPRIIREYNSNQNNNTLCSDPAYGKRLQLPHGLKGYFTYEEALKCGKERNLPVLIDFTGHACVSCREIEANVWSDPEVLKLLNTEFVIASLYVDDRTLLPKKEVYTSKYDQKVKRTLGAKNTDLSVHKFGINAQPYYILLDPNDEQPLVVPAIGYEPSVLNYMAYLNKGIAAYKKKHGK